MIVTPNMQLALRFENNIVDVGKGGITWAPNGATSAGYTAGKIGSAYAFSNPSNWLGGGLHTNPYNITNEFTWAAWVNIPLSVWIFDLCVDFNTPFGVSVQISPTGDVVFTLVSNSTSTYGNSMGRWNTGISIAETTTAFICGTRDSANGRMYKFDGTAWTSTVQAITTGAGNIAWHTNYSLSIGALRQRATSIITTPITSGWIDQPQIFNKALDFSDIQRLMHCLHPLHG